MERIEDIIPMVMPRIAQGRYYRWAASWAPDADLKYLGNVCRVIGDSPISGMTIVAFASPSHHVIEVKQSDLIEYDWYVEKINQLESHYNEIIEELERRLRIVEAKAK
jgi:hypothetical protein